MRFVMYYKIHNIPLLRFIFRQAHHSHRRRRRTRR